MGLQHGGDHPAALEKFRQVKDLEMEFGLLPNAGLFKSQQLSAKPVILSMIQSAKSKATGNKLMEARTEAGSAVELSGQYYLIDDPGIQSAMNDLNAMIFSRECQNKQDEINLLFENGKLQMQKRKYLPAKDNFEKAILLKTTNPVCALQSGSAEMIIDSIRDAAIYESMMEEIYSYQNQKRFDQLMKRYEEAGRFFYSQSVRLFGLMHPPLIEFASAEGGNEFLIFLAGRYTDQGEYENAVAIYDKLLERGLHPVQFKSNFHKTGVMLGMKDAKIHSGLGWKQALLIYTKGDKRFTIFGKGFRKGWKSVQ